MKVYPSDRKVSTKVRFILDSGEVLDLPGNASTGAIIAAPGNLKAVIPAKRLAATRQGYAIPLQDVAMVLGLTEAPFEVSVVCLDDVRQIKEGLTRASNVPPTEGGDRLAEFKCFI